MTQEPISWVDPDKLALDNCDREPIHRPGRIQGFAVLLITPGDLSCIDFASANCEALLGVPAEHLLGRPLDELLDRSVRHDIRNMLAMPTATTQRERVATTRIDGREFEIFVHFNPDRAAVIELEPLAGAPQQTGDHPLDRLRLILAAASNAATSQKFLNACVHGLRDLIGFDRVMAYRYDRNGDGEVIAEARDPNLDPYLGLRYPAWDVPQQVRAMQIKAPLRMLHDVHAAPVPLLGRDGAGDPAQVDISLAHSRGISPIHVEYLANMGVGSSMSLGLVVNGQLWGMFACHHREARLLRSDVRIAVELFAQMVSLLLQQRQELELLEARQSAEVARRRILAETDNFTDLADRFVSLAPVLSDLLDCDGVAVLAEDKTLTSGLTPTPPQIQRLAQRRADEDDLIEATDSLSHDGWADDISEVAGCLLVRCAAAAPLELQFFRAEKLRAVKWAGKPEKDLSYGPNGPRLSPRGSFEAYSTEQAGHAPPWLDTDLEMANEIHRLLVQISGKSARAELLRNRQALRFQRKQDLLVAELNHRVKNILALIRSLSRKAKESSHSIEAYANALEQRIKALAMAHDLAMSSALQGVSLRAILEGELGPYVAPESGQAVLAGPEVGLQADIAPIVALVIHEVATNAVKYGALSTSAGVVQVKWSLDDSGLVFTWRELGGPPVAPPGRLGFGRTLIERAIPYELDGAVELDYPASGFVLHIQLPDTVLSEDISSELPVVGRIGQIAQLGEGLRALLVEDNVVLALDMEESLARLGVSHVETAGTLKEGLRHAKEHRFDLAVLDMNLRGIVSFDIAHELKRRKVPFIFVTGYGSGMQVPADLSEVEVLTKPVDDGNLSQALERLKPGMRK